MSRSNLAIVICFAAVLARGQSVLQADQYQGLDAGEKIRKCIDALPATGGVCDARNLTGQQFVQSGFSVGSPGKPVELLLGPLTLTTKATIHVAGKSSIMGMPSSAGIGTDQSASVIKAADQSRLTAVVQLEAPFAVLQDLTVDGNKTGAPRGNAAILVLNAPRVQMFRVTAQNAPGYGIEIYSDNNQSCCAKLSQVMAVGNGGSGLHLANTGDVFISLSEFEDNRGSGIELNNSPTMRLQHSDIGGNLGDGIRVYGTGSSSLQSNRQMLIGNQFGNNAQHDINVMGYDNAAKKHVADGHLIASNEFIGSDKRPAGYDAIHLTDSGENNIVGNTFSAGAAHPYRYCVSIEGTNEGADQVTGNFCFTGAAGNKGYKVTANTALTNSK